MLRAADEKSGKWHLPVMEEENSRSESTSTGHSIIVSRTLHNSQRKEYARIVARERERKMDRKGIYLRSKRIAIFCRGSVDLN